MLPSVAQLQAEMGTTGRIAAGGGGGKKDLLRTPRQNFLKGTPRTTHPPPTSLKPLSLGP